MKERRRFIYTEGKEQLNLESACVALPPECCVGYRLLLGEQQRAELVVCGATRVAQASQLVAGGLCLRRGQPLHPEALLVDAAPAGAVLFVEQGNFSVDVKLDHASSTFHCEWAQERGGPQEPLSLEGIHVAFGPHRSFSCVDARFYLHSQEALLLDLHKEGSAYLGSQWISPSTLLSAFSFEQRLEMREELPEAALERAANAAFQQTTNLLPDEKVHHTLRNVAHIVPGRGKTQGVLLLTSYRVLFTSLDTSSYVDTIEDSATSLPLAAIYTATKVGPGSSMRFLEISLNNFGSAIFGFPPHRKMRRRVREYLAAASGMRPFAFKSGETALYPHAAFDAIGEYKRIFGQSLGTHYRMIDNSDFSVCETYPSTVVVPQDASDECIAGSASFRSKSRFPAVVWRHPRSGATISRCAQPKVGMKGNRNAHDEQLVQLIRGDSNPLYMVDSRPVANVMANKMIGLGHESSHAYEGVKLHFVGLGNIHVMRDAWDKLSALIRMQNGSDETKEDMWLSDLHTTNWLLYLKQILACAVLIARLVELKGYSVSTHCSDGWDRTSQLCALSQLILDPYYRTFDGFSVLVQKEWLSFGHKFATRHSPKDVDGSKAPIFLMFLDCVHQMLVQRPDAFEFNLLYLGELVSSTYSQRFGTFLYDSEKERRREKVYEQTPCVFSFLRAKKKIYSNPTYKMEEGAVFPETGVRFLQLWTEVYLKRNASWEARRTQALHAMTEEWKRLKSIHQKFDPEMSPSEWEQLQPKK